MVLVFLDGGKDGSPGSQGSSRRYSPSPHTKARTMSIAKVVELGLSHVALRLFRGVRRLSII